MICCSTTNADMLENDTLRTGKRGMRCGLQGVLIPTARLAATPVNGLLHAAALAAYC